MKKCEKFLELISLSIDGKTSPEEEEVLSEHLKDCVECRKTKEELIILKNDLKKIEIPIPERIKLKRLKINGAQKFPFSNYFAFLFSLVIFILIFLLWQNIINNKTALCLEVKRNIDEHFPIVIRTLKIKEKLPDNFSMEIEATFKKNSLEMKIIKSNHQEFDEKIIENLKKLKFEGFGEKTYHFKVYKCP